MEITTMGIYIHTYIYIYIYCLGSRVITSALTRDILPPHRPHTASRLCGWPRSQLSKDGRPSRSGKAWCQELMQHPDQTEPQVGFRTSIGVI